jgi:hypothetical protein
LLPLSAACVDLSAASPAAAEAELARSSSSGGGGREGGASVRVIAVNGEPHVVRAELARFLAARSSRDEGKAAVPSVQAFAARAGMTAADVAFLFESGALALPSASSPSSSSADGGSSAFHPSSPLAIPLDAVDSLLRDLDERSVLVPLSDIAYELGGSNSEHEIASMALDDGTGLRYMLRRGHYYLTPAHHARLRELMGL